MRFGTMLVAVCGGVGLALAVGCSSTPSEQTIRDNPSAIIKGDHGLQSKDLIEMSDKMAPSLLQIPEIAANPNRIVVVMTGIENRLRSDPTGDQTIYVARIKGMLNKNARDRILFVERRETTEQLQAAEGAPGAPTTRYVPQYALKGVFYDKVNNATTFYLCTFQLTNLATGAQVWEDQYEVRTGNAPSR